MIPAAFRLAPTTTLGDVFGPLGPVAVLAVLVALVVLVAALAGEAWAAAGRQRTRTGTTGAAERTPMAAPLRSAA